MRKSLSPFVLVAALTSACAPATSNCPPPVAATAPAVAQGPDPVVARIGGVDIKQSEIDGAAAHELYDAREQALDSRINEQVVEAAAKQAGLPAEDFLRKLAEARVPELTADEAQDFFNKNKDRMPPELADKPFAELKPIIIKGVTDQKRKAAMTDVIAELRGKAGVTVLLAPPIVQVAAIGPARGPSDARVTIVEFSDFQCPYCARGRQVMDEVVKVYGDKVRLVYRDFPLPFHEHAQKAAEAGQCAGEQGKFWTLHDWMFDHQDALAESDLQEAAKKLGLDGTKFNQCLASGKFAAVVAASSHDGEKAGVHGTPAFFVNGAFLSGAQPFDKFKTQIDRELAK